MSPHAKHAHHVILERFELTVQKGGKESKLQAPEEPSGKNLQRCDNQYQEVYQAALHLLVLSVKTGPEQSCFRKQAQWLTHG